jgi:hypothetical protein
MIKHDSQSIQAALYNWTKKMWEAEALVQKNTANALMGRYKIAHFEGKKVFPVGKCDGFDFVKGCPGHDEVESSDV